MGKGVLSCVSLQLNYRKGMVPVPVSVPENSSDGLI